MSEILWLASGVALHLAIAAGAAAFAARVPGYSPTQKALQFLVAAVVPLLGATIVVVMAREALAVAPGPDTSRFDPNYGSSN